MEAKELILEKHCGKVSVIYRINAYAAMQEYAEYYHTSQTEMPSDYRYCPYCGEELRGEIETVVGSPLVCKNTMCKQSLTKRR